MENEKWYHSKFFEYVGTGLGIALVLVGAGYGIKACDDQKTRINIERIRAKTKIPVIQMADLNRNGIADKFYVINGKIAVVELDGKPASGLDSKVLENNNK